MAAGVFVIEIERALLAGEIDIAVHSLKDLPTEETPGLAIAAVLPREDPRDVLVSAAGCRRIEDLPEGAVVGTGSPRRAAQTGRAPAGRSRRRYSRERRHAHPARSRAATTTPSCSRRRGSRASAGWTAPRSCSTTSEMLPAPGQGALAIQVRTDDAETFATVLQPSRTTRRRAWP